MLMPFFRSTGLVHVTPGEIRGVAVWRPPIDGPVTPLESLGPTPPLDHDQLARFLAGQAEVDALSAATFDEPAWYLDFLAVDPASQGRGLATALIAGVHAQADLTGVPCFLETFDGPNVSYYVHRGYEVAASVTVSFATEPLVAMRRGPAGARA
jgi:GNAT superfamily N-acetyltransferase